MRRERGFTLLELIIATAIVVVIGAAASMKFSQSLTHRDRVGERAGTLTSLQRAFLFIQRDIEQAIARPARDSLGDTQPALMNTPEGGIELTRTGWTNPLETRHRSTLQRVRYRLVEGRLIREYWDHPDRQVGSEPMGVVLLEKVEGLKIEYLHRPGLGEYRWSASWPLPEAGQQAVGRQPAPLAVSIELTLPPYGTLKRFFRVPANPNARVVNRDS